MRHRYKLHKYIGGKIKKKVLLLCVVLGFIFLASLVWFWILGDPANDAYEGLNMRPSWDVAVNIKTSPDTLMFSTLLSDNGYDSFLHDTGPYTIFAPTENAFSMVPKERLDYLFDEANNGFLRQSLLYHVVKGRYTFADLQYGGTLQTLQGDDLTFTVNDGRLMINDLAYIEIRDISSSNGVIHLITHVLTPPGILEE